DRRQPGALGHQRVQGNQPDSPGPHGVRAEGTGRGGKHMTPSPHADAELIALVHAYCNGQLDESRLAHLEQRLLEHSEARDFYLRYMNLDAGLREYGCSPAAWPVMDQPSSTPAADTTARSRRRLAVRWIPVWLALGAAAAAIMLIVVLLRSDKSATLEPR